MSSSGRLDCPQSGERLAMINDASMPVVSCVDSIVTLVVPLGSRTTRPASVSSTPAPPTIVHSIVAFRSVSLIFVDSITRGVTDFTS